MLKFTRVHILNILNATGKDLFLTGIYLSLMRRKFDNFALSIFIRS